MAVFLTACGQAADKGGEIVEPEEVVEEEPVEENVEQVIEPEVEEELEEEELVVVEIPASIAVKSLAEKLDTTAVILITSLMEKGIMATINQEIDFETASLLDGAYSPGLYIKYSDSS